MALTVASQVELLPGYRLIERLGAGGFGEVWKAEAPGGMLKAIKIVNGGLADFAQDETRLKQELKALNRVKTVRHPYILSLERFDIVDGRLIIVSELADRTLFDRYKECRSKGLPGIPRDELLRYMEEAAEALDLMSEQFNLQHLDIKPQNIFLLFNHVKVGDFGLVKDLDGMFAAVTSGVTAVYAAPETFEGVVSRYCDQYNLAIAYQEMLTGKLPFDGTTGKQLMLQHMMGSPDVRPLPVADQSVVLRALAKQPEERYPRCLDFIRALRGFPVADAERKKTPAPAGEPSSTPGEDDDHPTSNVRLGVRSTPQPGTGPDGHALPTIQASKRKDKPERSAEILEYVPPPPPPEKPETTGDGILMPALVVGLGGLGKEVLQEFRKALRKRGQAETWPQIRLLNIDTDADGHDRALREPDSVLAAEEFLVTHFQRPSHYLKRQHEREALERWLPLNQLTSLARGQTTADGWRALGRLAFVSSGSLVPLRLRQELDACANEKTLTEVAQRTSLGLKSTRPRVYVVTSLTGGTGSGMFLDVAAALRRELLQVGHPRAEVIGVFLVPQVSEGVEPRNVANSYAALRELKHFAAADTGAEHSAPFDRCVFVPLAAKAKGPAACNEVISLTGDFLCRELTAPLGRIVDEGRAGVTRAATGPAMQTFGAYWFSVPRRPLLRQVVHHICDRLVGGWGVHDHNAINAVVKSWAADQLTQTKLCLETLPPRIEEACVAGLQKSPKAWCEAITQRWQKGGAADLGQGVAAVRKVMADLEGLLGAYDNEPDLERPSVLLTTLWQACRSVNESAEEQLAEMGLAALTEPNLRMACKEEAAQEQLVAALDEAAKAHRRHSAELRMQATDYWLQLSPHIEELGIGGLFRGKAKARAADAIRTLLIQYLNARWQSAVSLSASRVSLNLHANLHKYRRQVNCCHKRIDQFVRTFGDAADAPQVDLGLGRYLLPFHCQTLEEAVGRILESLTPKEEDSLHEEVWTLIRSMLREHVHVCTTPPALFRDLRERIDRAAEKVAEDSLGRAHAAEVYMERQANTADADADLAAAFRETQPALGQASAPDREFSILAVPPGPEGEKFRALVKHALPDVAMRAAASTEDIVFYREQSLLSLDELPQTSQEAREQYKQFIKSQQYGPHSRLDIKW